MKKGRKNYDTIAKLKGKNETKKTNKKKQKQEIRKDKTQRTRKPSKNKECDTKNKRGEVKKGEDKEKGQLYRKEGREMKTQKTKDLPKDQVTTGDRVRGSVIDESLGG